MKAFTLIELIIVITILMVVSAVSYAPYNYYQNKAKLKTTASKISQLLYESRNKSINWSVWSSGNVSIWVYFDWTNIDNTKVDIYSYPHDIDNTSIWIIESSDVKKIETFYLDKGVQIDNIDSKNNLLFVFDSISGDVKYYNWNWWVRSLITDDKVDINFSYKWSTSINLQKTISYFTSTNIIDY